MSVGYETIRYWCNKFGRIYIKRLKKNADRFGDIIDILVQKRRDEKATNAKIQKQGTRATFSQPVFVGL